MFIKILRYKWCFLGFLAPYAVAYAGGLDLLVRHPDLGATVFLSIICMLAGLIPLIEVGGRSE